MTHYETTIIFSPELPAEKLDELVDKIKKNVENSEGKVLISEKIGRKKLAYPIKKCQEGLYVYFELNGTGKTISSVENFCKVNDQVIRYLTVKKAKKTAPAKTEAPKTEAPKAEAVKQEVKEVKENGDQHESPSPRTE
ncbi:MAG: 30S ribosomal protein S6 [Elusimicrobia bacterium]|nr:30S ribosomal protein S6 [Candidatus Liberimonas magnetica]